jgi:hypothetical protein
MTGPSDKNLVRPPQPMPEMVLVALEDHGLMERYRERPAYQRNDYLMWINTAKRAETKAKRLGQMIAELEGGTVYMGMAWRGGSAGRPVRLMPPASRGEAADAPASARRKAPDQPDRQ